jgi:hypothetical protein
LTDGFSAGFIGAAGIALAGAAIAALTLRTSPQQAVDSEASESVTAGRS